MKPNRRTIVGILVLVAAAAAVFLFTRTERQAPPRFETVQVDRGRIVARVTASGTLSALVTVQVGSQVSGRIQGLFVDFNAPVKKGQVLAKIDPQLFEASMAQARANFVAAQGNLTKAKVQALDAERQYERTRTLAGRKLIAQADLDTAQAGADAAKAQVEAAAGAVEQARAALHEAEVNLAYTTIASPVDGVVISRNVDVGQTVAASLQAPTLFVIAEDLQKMQVDTSVAEADVGKLTPGMPASFTVDAYPAERFHGVVRQIRNAPQTLQNVVTYDAVIDVENPERKLKPGMTANVTFVYAERQDVLRIPNAALRFLPSPELLAKLRGAPARDPGAAGGPEGAPRGARAPDEGARERTVWVLRGEGGPEPARIRTGVSDGTLTEVVEGGLREGDSVVTEAASGAESSGQRRGGQRTFRGIF